MHIPESTQVISDCVFCEILGGDHELSAAESRRVMWHPRHRLTRLDLHVSVLVEPVVCALHQLPTSQSPTPVSTSSSPRTLSDAREHSRSANTHRDWSYDALADEANNVLDLLTTNPVHDLLSINQSIDQNYLKWHKWWKPLQGPLSQKVTVKFRRELQNVKNMIAETSASSAGDRMYVKFQQMWCAPVDYSRCEVRQRRTLGCRPCRAWQVEYDDGSSWRNAERADLADRRRGWADQDNVVPVHSGPCKPGPRFCTQYVPGHDLFSESGINESLNTPRCDGERFTV